MAAVKTVHLITPITTKGLRNLNEIAHLKSSSLNFTHSLHDIGTPSIECALDEAMTVFDTVRLAVKAQQDGADAIVIDCMGDPGLEQAREAVNIPVLGPGETSMHAAAMLGEKFTVVTVLNSVKPLLQNRARIYGVDEKLASIRAINIPVLELETRLPEVQRRLAEEALLAVKNDNAHVIVLGCTGFLGCAQAIAAHLKSAGHKVPVIDPIPYTVCVAEAMAKTGLRHSKITYPAPRPKQYVGFNIPFAK
jgi:allantoin racemase